jgi:carbamoyl-phosphate synthase large subunit
MNVLITCAGRRSYLVDWFRDVVEPLGGQVITANSEPHATGLLAGDRQYLAPCVNSPSYIPHLLDIVRAENVRLVLSLFDLDIPRLAQARAEFESIGANVAVGDPWRTEICCDKWKMFSFLRAHGFHTPETWNSLADVLSALQTGQATFSLIVKPRWGSASIGIFKCSNLDELTDALKATRRAIDGTYLKLWKTSKSESDILIQSFIEGEEYGIDILNDFRGGHLCSAVKQKISQRDGSTEFAFTVDDPVLLELSRKISFAVAQRGNLDIDLIRSDSGEMYILDLNPRFGGGYPFSHLAGARFPRALVQSLLGEPSDPGTIEPNVYGAIELVPRRIHSLQPGVMLNTPESQAA